MAVDIGSSIGSAIKSASAVTSSAVSKTSSMFTTGLKDDVALVDNTAKSGLLALNTFKDNQVNALNGFIKKISGGAITIGEMSSFIDIRNGFKVDYLGLGKRLGTAAGFPIDTVMNMTSDIKQKAMDLLDAYSNKSLTGVFNALGIEIGLNDATYELTSMLTDVISRYSAEDSVFNDVVDRAAETSFLTVMLEYTVSAGLWEGIDTLLNQYTVKSDGIDALANSAALAISNGDVYTIRAVIDRVTPNRVLALNPTAIVEILRNFRFKSDTTNDQYPDYQTRLIDILNMLQPGWDKTTFGTVVARKLEPFTQASADATTLLQYDVRYRDQVLMAKQYPSVNLIDLLKLNYPTLAIIQ